MPDGPSRTRRTLLWTAWLVLGASTAAIGLAFVPGLFRATGDEDRADPVASLELTDSRIDARVAPDLSTIEVRSRSTIGLPPPGRFVLRRHGDRYDLAANRVSRGEVLRALADRSDFVLIDSVLEHPAISVLLEERSVSTLLSELLTDVPYTTEFGARGGSRGVGLARVVVGHTDEADLAGHDAGASCPRNGRGESGDLARRADRTRPVRATPARSEQARLIAMEQRALRQQRRAEEFRQDLESEDPEARALAVTTFDTEDPVQLSTIAPLLDADPDPRVRANVASELAWADPDVAVPMLMQALSDGSPEVVEAAAISLGTLEAASARSTLVGLTQHPSAKIREAAKIALAMLKGA